MPDYIDLLVTDDDLTLDGGGEPQLIFDRDCILQDTKHLIRDSGLLSRVIGQRDRNVVAGLMQQLELMIEEDVRLVPGTVEITRQDTGLFFCTATTVDYGPIKVEVVV